MYNAALEIELATKIQDDILESAIFMSFCAKWHLIKISSSKSSILFSEFPSNLESWLQILKLRTSVASEKPARRYILREKYRNHISKIKKGSKYNVCSFLINFNEEIVHFLVLTIFLCSKSLLNVLLEQFLFFFHTTRWS